MTSADVVGPDRAPPLEEEQLPTGLRGAWERTKLNVRTGNLQYFDRVKYPEQRLDVRHILASGALPPGFPPVKIGDRREVLPAHCCATMNLHRQAVAVRKAKVEAVWPIEASGRYD